MEKLYHIGRDPKKNEIYITESTISSSHAQIFVDNNLDMVLIDLSSKNGVFINNNKIKGPIKLADKDVIKFGKFTCSKEDIISAVKLFESNKKRGVFTAVPLISGNQQSNSIHYPKKNSIKKKITITLSSVLGFSLVVVAIFMLSKKGDTINLLNSDKQRTDIVYDFSCLNSELNNELLDVLREGSEYLLQDIDVSIQDELEAGKQMVQEWTNAGVVFINSGADYEKVNQIMNNLLLKLAVPKGYKYRILLYDHPDIGAYTCGATILISTGMLDFCKNESELATVIAHEIAHNELGHIKQSLKQFQVAEELGLADMYEDLTINGGILAGFNQKQEIEADLVGMDIVFATDYEYCSSISLWERVSEEYGEYKDDPLFMTHPYSKDRAECLQNHYKINYNMTCN